MMSNAEYTMLTSFLHNRPASPIGHSLVLTALNVSVLPLYQLGEFKARFRFTLQRRDSIHRYWTIVHFAPAHIMVLLLHRRTSNRWGECRNNLKERVFFSRWLDFCRIFHV